MFDFFKKKPGDVTEPVNHSDEGKSDFGLRNILANTQKALFGEVAASLENEEEFDDFLLDDMEELLIKADLSVGVASEIVDKLRKDKSVKPAMVKNYLKSEFVKILDDAGENGLKYVDGELNVYFITGVNGAGKTTLIGKLANRFKNSGKKVLVVAGDTFRAAAEEQLDVWAKRAGADIFTLDTQDAAAVVFDGVKKAKNDRYDVVLVDTAGRLQNKVNLMQELTKIKTVIDKNAAGSLRESILVIDANTGQNGLSQAKLFHEATELTAVALTKLDGSAKGGIVITIAKDMKLPVKLVGVGEKIGDIKNFNNSEFIDAIFGD